MLYNSFWLARSFERQPSIKACICVFPEIKTNEQYWVVDDNINAQTTFTKLDYTQTKC